MEQNPNMFISDVEHDTNLTVKGFKQADESGLHFKRRIEEVQAEYGVTFDEIRIDSSPFLRCLQTASGIAK